MARESHMMLRAKRALGASARRIFFTEPRDAAEAQAMRRLEVLFAKELLHFGEREEIARLVEVLRPSRRAGEQARHPLKIDAITYREYTTRLVAAEEVS